MATKLQKVSELTAETTSRLTHSIDEWMSFLDSAAWLYKYPWHEQTMIYAQRPDATACAPIELWNSTFKRWVNKGAKGIAIIDDSGQRPMLRYVFDISDTNTRYNIPFRLWEAKPKYYPQIIEELQNHFGDTGIEDGDLTDNLIGVVLNAVSDNYSDYAEQISKVCAGSALEGKEDSEIGSILLMQLITSVSHTVMVRMGLDPRSLFKGQEYDNILLFNTPETIAQIGTATADISEMVLRQIERSVRSIERQERDTLATADKVLQNEDRKNERSAEHGNNIQAERGLPDTRLDNGRAADGADRQIRDDEEIVPEGEPQRDVQPPAAERQADGASVGDRQDGAGAGRAGDDRDGDSRGRDGEPESDRSNGMGRQDEQHQAPGRGSDDTLPTHVAVDTACGLHMDSIVLMEQLRTIDKRRLGKYIGILNEKQMKAIDKAISASVSNDIVKRTFTEKDIQVLCPACAANLRDSGEYIVLRTNPFQIERESCSICNKPDGSPNGYDYFVKKKQQ